MNLEDYSMKKCSKCDIDKELCEFNLSKLNFYGIRSECRECQKISSKLYRERNRSVINEKAKSQYIQFPEIQKEKSKKWKENHNEDFRNSYLKSNKKWEEKNKDKRREYKNNYSTQRLKTDCLFKLRRNVRIRINKFLKNKKDNSSDIIGCSYLFLKEHLEKHFIDEMSWNNYGEWHIDHIIPLSSAKNEDEVLKLCHHTNLQPLWAEDNLKKSNKIL